jgi:uncharacterized protein (DUF2384 family)
MEKDGGSTQGERAELVLRMAMRVFGDATHATEWLAEPNGTFGGRAPGTLATDGNTGCMQVCQYLDAVSGE